MKNCLTVLGVIFLILIVLGVAAFGVVDYFGNNFDRSSKAFVDQAVPAIVSQWSRDEFDKRESNQFRKVTPDAELAVLFDRMRALGPMKSYDGATGDANMNYIPSTGLQISASYLAKVTCQNGPAEIRISLIRVGGDWQILGFRVNSPFFNR